MFGRLAPLFVPLGKVQADSMTDHTRSDKVLYGRGQPLSFTLSFGEIPWFDEEG